MVLRTATKNQLLGQLDRTFPGLTLALPDVLATKVGRLVAAEFADPARLAGVGRTRFIRFGATRGLQIRKPVADRLVQAARDALPTADAAVARASWPPTSRCWPTSTPKSTRPPTSWRDCCR